MKPRNSQDEHCHGGGQPEISAVYGRNHDAHRPRIVSRPVALPSMNDAWDQIDPEIWRLQRAAARAH